MLFEYTREPIRIVPFLYKKSIILSADNGMDLGHDHDHDNNDDKDNDDDNNKGNDNSDRDNNDDDDNPDRDNGDDDNGEIEGHRSCCNESCQQHFFLLENE